MSRIFILIVSILMLSSCANTNADVNGLPSSAITLDGSNTTSSASPSTSQSPSSTPQRINDPEAEIDIDDQSGDGTRLIIDEVEFSLIQVWIVIRSKSGIIFHRELLKYGTKKVSVQLQEPLLSGEYLVSLHSDNGDGIFDDAIDTVIRGHENELAREDFDYSRTS